MLSNLDIEQFITYSFLMSVSYPNQNRNYCVFNEQRIADITKNPNYEKIRSSLENPKNEDEVLENLYALNLIIDQNETEKENVKTLYPSLSKYNKTNSPNIQVFLAGLYRKTKIPDAFGPLCTMLIQNSITPPDSYFDPNEEIGGAILNYLA